MIAKAYRYVVDHLTKAIGLAGATLMSVIAYLDPASIREAAQTYLGDHAAAKMGSILFALVFVRGYFTGLKGRQNAQALADAQSALAQAQALAQIAAARAALPPPPAAVPAPVAGA